MAQTTSIGWTQNIVILENCETAEERTWYIDAVRRFHWPKAELLKRIAEGTHKNSVPPIHLIESTKDEPSSYDIDASNTI